MKNILWTYLAQIDTLWKLTALSCPRISIIIQLKINNIILYTLVRRIIGDKQNACSKVYGRNNV